MPTSIGRDEVQRLIGEGAHLVEVLPPTEYEEMHLPVAMNIPLKTRLRSDMDLASMPENQKQQMMSRIKEE